MPSKLSPGRWVVGVNPPEPDNPYTPLPDRYNQTRPDVAMDADGDFIFTWESVIPHVVEYGTITDVFARRFTPVGIADPNEVGADYDWFMVDTDFDGHADTRIQGVKPIESAWRVNATTTGAQGQPGGSGASAQGRIGILGYRFDGIEGPYSPRRQPAVTGLALQQASTSQRARTSTS